MKEMYRLKHCEEVYFSSIFRSTWDQKWTSLYLFGLNVFDWGLLLLYLFFLIDEFLILLEHSRISILS